MLFFEHVVYTQEDMLVVDTWVESVRSLVSEELKTNSFYSGRPPSAFFKYLAGANVTRKA